MIETDAGTDRHRDVAGRRPATRAVAAWGDRSLIVARRPRCSSVPRAAGPRPRRPVDRRRVARRSRSTTPVVLDALWLSLVDDRDQPRRSPWRSVCRSRSSSPAGSSAARAGRGGRRPADRPAAVGGRARAPARLRPARGSSAAPFDVLGFDDPVHDRRGDPRPDVRVGTVLRPLGADRHRGRRPRPRGRRPGGRRDRARSCSARSRSRSPARRSPPAWS